MDLEILTEELMFFDLTYELIEHEQLKTKDEDLYRDRKGEISKLSRVRLKCWLTLEQPQSSSFAFGFSVAIQVLIIISVLVFILERYLRLVL